MSSFCDNEGVIPEATKANSGSIRAIAQDTVHKICSGQVVLSLAVAVKELVENSIDAGATLVEVKLHNQGLESLEVSDNGCGVKEVHIEAMTAKYHTSKIKEFVDLQGVKTFGFRGEALSSLCALAKMCVVTRHKDTEIGLKIELNHSGKICKRILCARPVGTTVVLSNLFGTLPVRRRDFIKNIKKEFTKMCQMLQAYCLVSKGVRIICTNQTNKGNKTTVMQTYGSDVTLDNIAAIFGNKQAADILHLPLAFGLNQSDVSHLSDEALLVELQGGTNDMQITIEDVKCLRDCHFNLEGYVSSCAHGAGRSSNDRQFYYVNSRPCDPKNIPKLINEIYHRFNVQQYPFVFLNIFTPRCDVDVNLTPDKRQLLINNEKILLLLIKKSLINMYINVPSTYKMQNTTIVNMMEAESTKHAKDRNDSNNSLSNSSNSISYDKSKADRLDYESISSIPLSCSQGFANVLSQWKSTGNTFVNVVPNVSKKRKSVELSMRTLKMKKINEYQCTENEDNFNNNGVTSDKYLSDTDENEMGITSYKNEKILEDILPTNKDCEGDESKELNELNKSVFLKSTDYKKLTPTLTSQTFLDFNSITASKVPIAGNYKECNSESDNDVMEPQSCWEDSNLQKSIQLDISDSETTVNFLPTKNQMCISLKKIDLFVDAEQNIKKTKKEHFKLNRLCFKSKINPHQNQLAEDELQKEINKTSFECMEILGQFNLGFIIVKLDADLFIVDQHATDEKYNYEILQTTTVLQHQKLAVAQPLEMTAVNEMILMDNVGVFEKNGFKFDIIEFAPPTKKIRLSGKPFSKNWEFGKDDIDELIFMLQDAPEGTVCRPSRIRAMFASRACRKSVMIGKALNRATMRKLIRHMGEIDQPWNCPHGRPTMRHLINITMLMELVDDKNSAQE